jgi:hypothetical protein
MHSLPCPLYAATEKIIMSIHPSLPLKTPSLAVSMCSGDGGTRRGRGGDSDIGPLTAIEKGMRGKGPHGERSVFEGMVVVSGRRGCLVAALMPFSHLRMRPHQKCVSQIRRTPSSLRSFPSELASHSSQTPQC